MSLLSVLVVFGLLQAGVADSSAADGGAPALVVVALPAEADPAILEALHRLRGEATSVGFEVRLVGPATESLTLEQLEAEHIRRVLAATATMEDASAKLGIDPSTLYRKRKKYGL